MRFPQASKTLVTLRTEATFTLSAETKTWHHQVERKPAWNHENQRGTCVVIILSSKQSSLQSFLNVCISFSSVINYSYNSQLQTSCHSVIYRPRISKILGIKWRLMIYLPLCSSSTHNPVHFPRRLRGPRLPWQTPSATSTEREGPWRVERRPPFKNKNKKRGKINLHVFSVENLQINFLSWIKIRKSMRLKKHGLHVHSLEKNYSVRQSFRLSSMQMCTHFCIHWWKVTEYTSSSTWVIWNFYFTWVFPFTAPLC